MSNLNILINKDFRGIAKGNNITAIEHQDEFLFTADSDFPVATVKEIAKVNGFSIPTTLRKRVDQNEFAFNELNKLKIAESTMSKLEKILPIVNAGVDAGKSDDEIKIEIIQSGVTFKEAGKLFTEAMEQAGYRISPKQRMEKIEIILEDAEFNPETTEQLEAMIKRIAFGNEEAELEAVADTSEKQALAAIRKWCKENEIELPKAPKKSAGRAAGGDMNTLVCGFMVEQGEFDSEKVTEFIKSKKENVTEGAIKSYLKHAERSFNFATKYLEKHA